MTNCQSPLAKTARAVGTKGGGGADKSTISQPRGGGQIITTKLLTSPPGFSDLPTALQVVHDDHFIDFHYQDL